MSQKEWTSTTAGTGKEEAAVEGATPKHCGKLRKGEEATQRPDQHTRRQYPINQTILFVLQTLG